MVQRDIKQNGGKRKNPETTEKYIYSIGIFLLLMVYPVFAWFYIKLFSKVIPQGTAFAMIVLLLGYAYLIIELYIYRKTGRRISFLKEI
jgi:hypothetical protein